MAAVPGTVYDALNRKKDKRSIYMRQISARNCLIEYMHMHTSCALGLQCYTANCTNSSQDFSQESHAHKQTFGATTDRSHVMRLYSKQTSIYFGCLSGCVLLRSISLSTSNTSMADKPCN